MASSTKIVEGGLTPKTSHSWTANNDEPQRSDVLASVKERGAFRTSASREPALHTEKRLLRVLMVEDSDLDAQLIARALRKGGYFLNSERVETAETLRRALLSKPWDLILADYNLPQFSAFGALEVLHETGLDLPFIVVSGTIGESTAVAAMKAGAHDYLMKGSLARLVPAVERELREAANRAAKKKANDALRQSELRYRMLWETATDAIVLIDPASRIHFANPAVEDVFGYKPEEIVGKTLATLQPEDLRKAHRDGIQRYLRTGERRVNWRAVETVGLKKDGTEIPVEVAFSDMESDGKRWFVGFIRDISERKRTEEELLESQEQFRVARDIQQHLFPARPPELRGFDIAGASRPAEATGGDYFDYLSMVGEQWGMVVGDVTGHGVGPALLMAEARAYLRILAKNHDDVGDILTRANAALAEDIGGERFITLLLAQLDPTTRTLTYANAGHPSGYVLDDSGETKKMLTRTGIPLGIRSNTTYVAAPRVVLNPGETVVLLTDGFEEALSNEEVPFGIERTLDVVRRYRHESANEILHRVFQALSEFTNQAPQEDDLTLVILKIL